LVELAKRGQTHAHVRKLPTFASRTTYLAFALLGFVWGSNFIFGKWAAREITPSQIVPSQVVFGFVPVALDALQRRTLVIVLSQRPKCSRWVSGAHLIGKLEMTGIGRKLPVSFRQR
jgi:hypothetical protein